MTEQKPRYTLTHEVLGEGSFGTVEKADCTFADGTHACVAVKRILLSRYPTNSLQLKAFDDAGEEFDLSRVCQESPYVLSCNDICYEVDLDEIRLAMDAGDQDLEAFVRSHRSEGLPPRFLLSICKQCTAGLEALHAGMVVHRDVKPPNFIVNVPDSEDLPPLVRCADFGLSVSIKDRELRPDVVGTSGYMAPELDNADTILEHPSAMDVYSLGITFVDLVTGSTPTFKNVDGRRQMCMPTMNSRGLAPSAEEQAVLAVALRMVAEDPSARPSAKEVLQQLQNLGSTPMHYSLKEVSPHNASGEIANESLYLKEMDV